MCVCIYVYFFLRFPSVHGVAICLLCLLLPFILYLHGFWFCDLLFVMEMFDSWCGLGLSLDLILWEAHAVNQW